MDAGQAKTIVLSIFFLCFHRKCSARCDLWPHAAATTIIFLVGKAKLAPWVHDLYSSTGSHTQRGPLSIWLNVLLRMSGNSE